MFIDNSAAITIIQNGFSKGLLWLAGVASTQVATNKGRMLKISWLHDLAAKLVKHTGSAFMRADPLTKQLPTAADLVHAQRSLQLYPQGTIKKRCACIRCEGPNVFCKTRCDELIDIDQEFCEHCKGHAKISPRNGVTSCSCPCRGIVTLLIPMASSTSIVSEERHSGYESYQEDNIYTELLIGRRRSDAFWTQRRRHYVESEGPIGLNGTMWSHRAIYGFPTAGTEWDDVYSCTKQIEFSSDMSFEEMNNWIGIGIGIYLIFWTLLFGVGLKRYIRQHGDGDDQKMLPAGRGSRGGGGGGGKRQAGGGSDDDDLANAFRGLDLRTPDQREKDELRRLLTQCIYVGWFDKRDDDEQATNANVGGKKVYRRCAASWNQRDKPHCSDHAGKSNEPGPGPEHDPSVKKDKDGNIRGKNKKGLGSLNDMITGMMRRGGAGTS